MINSPLSFDTRLLLIFLPKKHGRRSLAPARGALEFCAVVRVAGCEAILAAGCTVILAAGCAGGCWAAAAPQGVLVWVPRLN